MRNARCDEGTVQVLRGLPAQYSGNRHADDRVPCGLRVVFREGETPYGVLAARAEEAWLDTLAELPVGTRVTAAVIGRQPFGAFLSFEGFPRALGLAKVSRKPRGRELPYVGSTVEGRVYWHDPSNHQVNVELREWVSDW